MERSWHAEPAEAVLAALGTSGGGLTADEARARQAAHGPNVLPAAPPESAWRILGRQLSSPLVWVLLASGGVAGALGETVDAGVVFGVVVLNTLVGFAQELRASRAIAALSGMVSETASVWRDGRPATVPAAELVDGDVVTLASGDRVPADLRVLEVHGLRVDESQLTGESLPVEKDPRAVEAKAGLGDRTSMAWTGSLVTYGTARGVVVAIGARTELGKISGLMVAVPELETPLTRALARLSTQIAWFVLALSALMIGVGTARLLGEGLPLVDAVRDTILFAIALAVGAVPEGLPATVTIALAIGVQRMARRRAIIRHLPAVETLGSTSVICTDKTGTLTKNEMTLVELWRPAGASGGAARARFEGVGYAPVGAVVALEDDAASGPDALRSVLTAAVRASDADLPSAGEVFGDPTELALVVGAAKLGLDPAAIRAAAPRLDVLPFESDRKLMAVESRVDGTSRIELKGAPEVVLPRVADVEVVAAARAALAGYTARALRVLAVAEVIAAPETTKGGGLGARVDAAPLRLLGLAAMMDPVRPEAVAAVATARRAGITVKMITGDHPDTAAAIGAELGLVDATPAPGAVVTGAELDTLDDAAWPAVAERGTVFARVAPEHKLRLVRALQGQGRVVAMTGDGVNDAPALEQADVGVAMGQAGSSVAREAADVILTDDDFATIVAAIEEGRRVYDNLIKSLVFILPTNLGLAGILGVALVAFPFDVATRELLLPVRATQILWINLVCAVALALPLAFEALEPDAMTRPPRAPSLPVLTRFVLVRTTLVAALMTAASIALFAFVRARCLAAGLEAHAAVQAAQTAAVTTVVAFQSFYLLTCRALRGSVFARGRGVNPLVFVGIGALWALQLAFVYAPPFQAVFDTRALAPDEVGAALLAGAAVLPLIALEKGLVRPDVDR
jgi:magnesium-transporting ATPase (P-type)